MAGSCNHHDNRNDRRMIGIGMKKMTDIKHVCRTCDHAMPMDATFFCEEQKVTIPWIAARGCKEWKRRD